LYKRQPNEKLDLYTRQELSRDGGAYNLEQHMSKWMQSEAYSNMTIEEQRVEFDREVKSTVQKAKKIANGRVEREAAQRSLPYSEADLQSWIDTPELVSDLVESEYRKLTGRDSVTEDRNLILQLDNGDRINVLQWALSRAKQRKGGTQ